MYLKTVKCVAVRGPFLVVDSSKIGSLVSYEATYAAQLNVFIYELLVNIKNLKVWDLVFTI